MKVKALLFDTRSIQKYIFSGNKLKTNIGASFLVDQLFSKFLVEDILQKELNYVSDVNEWKNSNEINIYKNRELCCEVGYIGGGNAVLLFNPDKVSDDEIDNVVKLFTKKLLLEAPGLKTGVAKGELVLGEGDQQFKDSMNKLYQVLKNNQNLVAPRVNPIYTGLTLECNFSGEVADIYEPSTSENNEKRYVSSEFLKKFKYADQANKALKKKFEGIITDKVFPEELEKLGQVESESYIGIVHIDGNNMGKKFMECNNLQERKAKSKEIAEKVEEAFSELLKEIIAKYDNYNDITDKGKKLFKLRSAGKEYLPIRPLILGGDDVTFVCHGRLAIEFAKRYIEFFEAKGIDSCAGVSIISTTYPFFRGYQIAEELCGKAKEKARKNGGSWLDFSILHGEQAPTLAQIRRQEYTGSIGNCGDMHFGPYNVSKTNYHFSIENLLSAVTHMSSLPRNKVKEMRLVLSKGQDEITRYMNNFKKENKLPQIAAWKNYEENLWYQHDEEWKTPYVDVIELMDFVVPRGKNNEN